MADPSWCPSCGSEFRSGYTTCPDCGVDLVPDPPAAPGPRPPSELAGREPVAYDLQDWPPATRDSLEWMLAGLEIPFDWDPPGVLMVPEGRAEEVEGFIEYLDAGAETDEPAGEIDASDLEARADDAAATDDGPAPLDDHATATGESATSATGLVAPVGWLEPQLDALRGAYLVQRADHDAETAFEQALATTLDIESRDRLASVFHGDQDHVYGAGFGERAGQAMRDALERLAWTVPDPNQRGPAGG